MCSIRVRAGWQHVPRGQELRGPSSAGTAAAPAGLGVRDPPGRQRLGIWRGASREVARACLIPTISTALRHRVTLIPGLVRKSSAREPRTCRSQRQAGQQPEILSQLRPPARSTPCPVRKCSSLERWSYAEGVPLEFRRDVVAVARKGEAPLSRIAKDFGISESCLHRWLKRSCGGLRRSSPANRLKMKYPLVLDLAADGIPVAVTCRVLGSRGQRWPVAQDIGERLGQDVIGGPPRRPGADRGHQGFETPRPNGVQRLSRPHGARLLQRDRELGAYRSAFLHHRAGNVKSRVSTSSG